MIRDILQTFFLTVSLIASFSALAVDSDNSPIAVSIVTPVQFPNAGYGITGLRLGILGMNREARGLDLALLGHVTDRMFKGIAIAGLFNYNRSTSYIYGLQIAGLANINSGTNGTYGIQIALFNKSQTVHGLQLGLLNMANELHGVQIGLFNMNKNGPFHGSPIINAAF